MDKGANTVTATVRVVLKGMLGLLCLFSLQAVSAPVVEVFEERVRVSLPPYIDVLEDSNGGLTFEEVSSERYANQFSPSPLTDLYFGYTSSTFWLRFSVENQLDSDKQFILEVTPADLDFIDVYQVDHRNQRVLSHKKSGSAVDFDERDYDHPLYFFNVVIPSHTAHTFYVRLQSNKTINAQLMLSSIREHFFYSGMRDWWQGFLFGALLLLAFVHLCLAYVFKYKGFVYFSMMLGAIIMLQASWNGYFLQFLQTDAVLLDKQLMFSVYLSTALSLLFTRSYLDTHHRAPVSHRVLTVMIVLTLLGMPCSWLFDTQINAILLTVITVPAIFFVFGLALFSYMEGYVPARCFLVARTITIIIILITLFSVQGLLPQDFSSAWGIAVAFVLEGVIFLYAMVTLQMTKSAEGGRMYAGNNGLVAESSVPVSAFCHELRTPISGVMGMTELIMETSLTEQQKVQLESVKNSGDHLLDIVNKMSDLSSLESGDIELHEVPFDIPSVVEACVENSRNFSERRNIELIYKVDEAVSGFVKGDQEKLQQVLNNLISFTIRQMDAGEVLISVSGLGGDEVQFELLSGKNTYAKEYTLSMFTADENHTSADSLNLSLARQLIRLMGGELHTQHRSDGGTRLHFQLSLQKARREGVQEENDQILRDKRLLVVDDNDTCCKIVQQQATLWGMDVVIASSGKEALALMRSHANLHEVFDLMLIDYDMPGMNGVELAAKIRLQKEQYLAQNTIMLILTGVSKMPSQILEQEEGIYSVLYKPLSGKSLKRALIDAFSLHKGANPAE